MDLSHCYKIRKGTCQLNSQDVILGILMQSDASGYDIKQQFEKPSLRHGGLQGKPAPPR
ncbi:hypothetical protein PM3016_1652 [Paenibacillus mucilaginosus 3016]|uniref:Uncharacterized protein n=2 Tax=Paenibacillus mucilaginosus TaxID=61624 RepID=H6NCF7_9BACL|nr:hypothetical protein PM3016_1652 [Paenibacillus mucilaginosus 3016]AFH60735.1 hypothetical protein B2K_08385 [Paenibacillus mucilaginosus K02]